MNSIESNICDAIELLIDHAISQASFDRTIQATVIRCVDPSIGKYLIRYQDSTFYAYSNNIAINCNVFGEFLNANSILYLLSKFHYICVFCFAI